MGSSFADMQKQLIAFCDVHVAQNGVPRSSKDLRNSNLHSEDPYSFQAEGIDVSRSGCRACGFKGLESGLRIEGRCSNCSRLCWLSRI